MRLIRKRLALSCSAERVIAVTHGPFAAEIKSSVPGRSMWDLWYLKWYWDGFFFDTLCFPCQSYRTSARHLYFIHVPSSTLYVLKNQRSRKKVLPILCALLMDEIMPASNLTLVVLFNWLTHRLVGQHLFQVRRLGWGDDHKC